MAISKDTLEQKIDKLAADDELQKVQFETPEAPSPIDPNPYEGLVEEPMNVATEEPGPIEVAGLKDVVVGLVKGVSKERMTEAERKVVPPLPDEPVQRIGGSLVVREATEEEVADLAAATGGAYTKGLNVVRIGDNLDQYDLGQHLARIKDANADLFEAQRRGTLNMEALEEMAMEQGMDNIVAEWLSRTPGTGETAEKILAGMIAQRQTTNETIEAFTLAVNLPEGSPEAKAAFSKGMQLMTIEANLLANLSGAGSEAGRTLYMLSNLPDYDLSGRASELRNLFNAQDTMSIEHIGKSYLAIPDRAGKSKFVQGGILAKSMDVVTEVWINSILTGPATHMVNIAGNSLFQMTRIAETAVASGIGAMRQAAAGTRKIERVRIREALVRLDGIRGATKDALLVAGRTALTEEAADAASKIDVRYDRRAIGTTGDPRVVTEQIRNGQIGAGFVNILGISARMGGRALLAEDEFFKAIAYRSELRTLAMLRGADLYDEAIDAGKTVEEAKAAAAAEEARIMSNPPSGLVKDAQEAARAMTFQSDIDGLLGSLQGLASHPTMKLFVPFYKTPVNVMKETLARTPLALLNPKIFNAIKAGGREADFAMAQIATGSAVMSIFAAQAMGVDDPDNNVIIMGSGPSDRTARQAMARQGFQPYSINFKQEDGTYRSVTFSRLDPISGLLAMAADFAYYAQYEEDPAVLDTLATAAVVGIAGYMQEMPMLDEVKELGRVLNRPDGKGQFEAFVELFAQKGAEAALSFMPLQSAFSAGIARVQDPTLRSTMMPEEGLFGEDPTQMPAAVRGFYAALQRAKARNPLFNGDLPPRLNLWAEEIRVGAGAGWEMVSPVRIRDTQYAPVDEELMRLGQGIPMPSKKIDGVLLNAVQYNQILTDMNNMDNSGRMPGQPGYKKGQTLVSVLMGVIDDEMYQDLPTKEDKLKVLKGIVSKRRQAAVKKLRSEDPVLNQRVFAQQ